MGSNGKHGGGAAHELTLMKRTMMEWMNTRDGKQPFQHQLRCQECGRVVVVDISMSQRGDYFCDGSEQASYVRFRADAPSMREVADNQWAEGLVHSIKSLPEGEQMASMDQLAIILHRMRSEMDNLEAWLYLMAHAE